MVASTNFFALLPLYIYPAPSSWQPLYTAITNYPNVQFQVIISPNVGPGSGIPDSNYIAGITKLNAFPNVKTLGYVYTGYGNRLLSSMENDINIYKSWSSYNGSDISMDGIFFDGTPSSTNYLSYLQSAASYARNTMKTGNIVYLNPGRPVDASMYSFVDYLNAFEDLAIYTSDKANGLPAIPAANIGKSSIILHDYQNSTAQMKTDVCSYIAQGYTGGLITTGDGGFNAFSATWQDYIADISSCLASSTTPAKASATSACPTPNATLKPGQIVQNPSFENVDASCKQTLNPWTATTFVADKDWQTADGVWYVTAFANSAGMAQALNTTTYGNYTLGLSYRITNLNIVNNGLCNIGMQLDSKTYWYRAIAAGNPTVGDSPMTTVSIPNVVVASGNPNKLVVGYQCNNSGSSISVDYDNISLTLTKAA